MKKQENERWNWSYLHNNWVKMMRKSHKNHITILQEITKDTFTLALHGESLKFSFFSKYCTYIHILTHWAFCLRELCWKKLAMKNLKTWYFNEWWLIGGLCKGHKAEWSWKTKKLPFRKYGKIVRHFSQKQNPRTIKNRPQVQLHDDTKYLQIISMVLIDIRIWLQ